jgi:hypothetical protein
VQFNMSKVNQVIRVKPNANGPGGSHYTSAIETYLTGTTAAHEEELFNMVNLPDTCRLNFFSCMRSGNKMVNSNGHVANNSQKDLMAEVHMTRIHTVPGMQLVVNHGGTMTGVIAGLVNLLNVVAVEPDVEQFELGMTRVRAFVRGMVIDKEHLRIQALWQKEFVTKPKLLAALIEERQLETRRMLNKEKKSWTAYKRRVCQKDGAETDLHETTMIEIAADADKTVIIVEREAMDEGVLDPEDYDFVATGGASQRELESAKKAAFLEDDTM